MGFQLVVVGEEGFFDIGFDYLYFLLLGIMEEEFLCKLNEQWDILVLMEVKMKEMKGSICYLCFIEVKLCEELCEKDWLFVMVVICKKYGM